MNVSYQNFTCHLIKFKQTNSVLLPLKTLDNLGFSDVLRSKRIELIRLKSLNSPWNSEKAHDNLCITAIWKTKSYKEVPLWRHKKIIAWTHLPPHLIETLYKWKYRLFIHLILFIAFLTTMLLYGTSKVKEGFHDQNLHKIFGCILKRGVFRTRSNIHNGSSQKSSNMQVWLGLTWSSGKEQWIKNLSLFISILKSLVPGVH